MADQLNTNDVNDPAEPIQEMLVADDGRRTSTLSIEPETTRPMTFWHADEAKREANLLRWDDGTTLTITKGTIDSIDPDGYEDRKSHYGSMKYADPHPMYYPVIKLIPEEGVFSQDKYTFKGFKSCEGLEIELLAVFFEGNGSIQRYCTFFTFHAKLTHGMNPNMILA